MFLENQNLINVIKNKKVHTFVAYFSVTSLFPHFSFISPFQTKLIFPIHYLDIVETIFTPNNFIRLSLSHPHKIVTVSYFLGSIFKDQRNICARKKGYQVIQCDTDESLLLNEE